ncbi:GNAT family N-acetyltransferase [Nocardiopsis terrae]
MPSLRLIPTPTGGDAVGGKQAVVETGRLRLEPLVAGHTDDVVELFGDPAMSTHLGVDLSEGGLARIMVDNRPAYDGPPEFGHWAILGQGRVVGLAHLRPSRELPGDLPEIGWYLGHRYGGRGLATEAARALLRHGLDGLGLASVWALVHVDNVPSLRLAERLGFLPVGEGFHYGGPHRVHVALPDRV